MKKNSFSLRIIILFVGLSAAILTGMQQKELFPRIWTEKALKDWELPLANPEYSPLPVSEEHYYNLPERVIYKTYPVYHPDFEPEGYQSWLMQQEPEIVFDPSKLKTEEDWIEAGELLFDYPIDTAIAVISAATVKDPEFYKATNMPVTKEGIMPYARWVVTDKGKVFLGNLSCGMCHTKVMPDSSLVKGAQGNFPGDKAFAFMLEKEKFSEQQIKAITQTLFGSPWVEGDPHGKLASKSKEEILAAYKAVPDGAFGRQGTSIIFPAQIPDLIGIKDRKYLDQGGLGQHRSEEDMMRYIAMNQSLDFMNFYKDYHPLGLTKESMSGKLPQFSGTYDRYSDAQLLALTKYLYSLEPPENPNKPSALSEKGKKIFMEQGCVTCHTPPSFTNNMLTPANGFDIPDDHYEKYDIFDISIGTDSSYTLKTRRGTGYYKIPSLRGLWYRSVLLHDASLANLEDMFDPARLNDDYVPSGFKGAGVKEKAVPGHEFGMSISNEEKEALVAYLLTL